MKNIDTNGTPYCSYTYTMTIVSGGTVPFQASLTDDFNNVVILPSTFTIQPGINNLTFTVIPQSPFSGGSTEWTIQGSYPFKEGFIDCINGFTITVPFCEGGDSKSVSTEEKDVVQKVVALQELTLYPNPAKDLVTLRYTLSNSDATLEIYDLSGRIISKNVLTSLVGELQVNTNTYAAGMYMVVVKQNGNILAQKKLIIE